MRTMSRLFQAFSTRPSRKAKLPPPWAKQIRKVSGRRSKAPDKTRERMDSCVSAGMATSHCSMYFGMRSGAIMSHGWTSTAAPSAAQCCRNVTSPSSSRFFGPTWLPICTPRCPAFMARLTSSQDESMSCNGTWHSAFRRPGLCPHNSRAASLNSLAHSRAWSAGLS